VFVLTLPYYSWTLGVNALGFRYRFPVKQEGTKLPGTATTTNFALAVSFGRTFGNAQITPRVINTYTITPSVFIGPSSADLKKTMVKTPSTWVTDQTNATLVYGASAVLARNNLGFVLAVGLESMLGSNSTEWVYNNQPLLGFGINSSFGK
jgi:hypothetical protein